MKVLKTWHVKARGKMREINNQPTRIFKNYQCFPIFHVESVVYAALFMILLLIQCDGCRWSRGWPPRRQLASSRTQNTLRTSKPRPAGY